SARLKICIEFRQVFGQFAANAPHVFIAAELVVFFQAHQDKCRIHGRVAGVHGGEVGGNPYIGDDHPQVVGVNYLVNIVLDARDVLIGDLKPGTAGRLDVDDELARIGAGKVRCPHEWENSRQDKGDAPGNPRHGSPRPGQSARHPTLVKIQELLEELIEPAKEPHVEGSRSGLVL